MYCRICNAAVVHPVRLRLGYDTCIDCGDVEAKKESERRRKCIAPAFNKGPIMYIGSVDQARDAGKK